MEGHGGGNDKTINHGGQLTVTVNATTDATVINHGVFFTCPPWLTFSGIKKSYYIYIIYNIIYIYCFFANALNIKISTLKMTLNNYASRRYVDIYYIHIYIYVVLPVTLQIRMTYLVHITKQSHITST